MKKLSKRRLPVVLAVAVGTGMLCCVAFLMNMFNSMQLYSSDVLFKTSNMSQTAAINDKIVIVAIDDNSLEELGRISLWPRSYYAHVVDVLTQSKARVIVFDVLFSEPSADDARFAASLKVAGDVIIPVAAKATAASSTITDGSRGVDILIRPVPVLAESAVTLGHADVHTGQDGTVRDLSLFVKDGNGDVPALSLATAAKYLRRPGTVERSIDGGVFSMAGRSIPVTNGSDMIINYRGGSDGSKRTIFKTVSFVDVLKGNVDAGLFGDKIAIIGSTASGLGDSFWTPLGTKLNGVEIHASAVNTILSGSFLRSAPPITTVVCIITLCLLCGLLVVCFPPLLAALMAALLGLAYVTVVAVFFESGLMLNPFYPSLGILSSFISMTLCNVVWERSRRNTVEKIFGRYVSPSISNRILTVWDRGNIKLDGEEQELTVAFADIRGFTAIAHSVETQELVRTLNKYLAVLIKAVNRHQGIVNKFSGDGIMAIWNAPTACEKHHLMAVRAALEAQKAIKELQQKEPSLLRMDFGIGVSTGNAVCGNLGCEDRLEYSAIGPTVNRAARITAAAPGGTVLISDETYKLAGDYIEATSLGDVTIKGEKEPIQLYEVVRVYSDPDNLCETTERDYTPTPKLDGVFERLSKKWNSASKMTSGKSGAIGRI
jgi:adenylate cyclase